MNKYALLPILLAFAVTASAQEPNPPPCAGPAPEPPKHERMRPRPEMPKGPRNVSFVIDCSKQSARKFEFVKKSLARSIESLQPDDIVSVVAYDDSPRLVVPMCEAKDKEAILEKIASLQPKGNRALFAAISQGAEEVRKGKKEGYRSEIVVFGSEEAEIGPSGKEMEESVRDSLKREEIGIFFRSMPPKRMEGFPKKPDMKDKKIRRPFSPKGEGKLPPREGNEE